MIRKSQQYKLEVKLVIPDDSFANSIYQIYNESQKRQERTFDRYGITFENVKKELSSASVHSYIGAYYRGRLIGFAALATGTKNTAILSQFLSFKKEFEKAPNNALINKIVELSSSLNIKWLIYGRMGNHPTLDRFKESNGFVKYELKRYYAPLTRKGEIAMYLGLHRDLKDKIPEILKPIAIPVYNYLRQ